MISGVGRSVKLSHKVINAVFALNLPVDVLTVIFVHGVGVVLGHSAQELFAIFDILGHFFVPLVVHGLGSHEVAGHREVSEEIVLLVLRLNSLSRFGVLAIGVGFAWVLKLAAPDFLDFLDLVLAELQPPGHVLALDLAGGVGLVVLFALIVA